MKYVVLGHIGRRWGDDPEGRMNAVHQKLSELSITLETVYYTQGDFDFMEVVDASPQALLAFSLWYSRNEYGTLVSMPAFSMEEVSKAVNMTDL